MYDSDRDGRREILLSPEGKIMGLEVRNEDSFKRHRTKILAGYASRLQRMREDCGYTQEELAKKSGVAVERIQQFEWRGRNINKAAAENVFGLARALDCSMEQLLEQDDTADVYKAFPKIPVGIDIFEKVRSGEYYYVDKTGIISELLEQSFEVSLFTRPRRFGKTLALSMLSAFFDIRCDNRALFENLEIANNTEVCEKWMNQYPVIFLSLKDVQGITFEKAYSSLQYSIAQVCIEHAYLENSSNVDSALKDIFGRLKRCRGTEIEVQGALDILMKIMQEHYNRPVILLIDEYDVPLAASSENGYYRQMLDVIRNLLSRALKTNQALKFAVITGCLRISKESIFTGVNNLVSDTISDTKFSEFFGFTPGEVGRMLEDAKLADHMDEIKKWYDGYLFGRQEIYCPWDVLNHIAKLRDNPYEAPRNYWKNTSHNGIIRSFIDQPKIDVREKMEILLAGFAIQTNLVEDLTYDALYFSEDNLWSVLYLSGYLTKTHAGALPEDVSPEQGKVCLKIPNAEIKTIFSETVAGWFEDSVKTWDRRDEMFRAWWDGDDGKLTEIVTDMLFGTISYYDYKEDYYHAFLTGLFVGAGYGVSSNSEKGRGRPDIIVKDRKNRRAIIIEVKHSRTEKGMERDCYAALDQIDVGQYARQFLKGYRKIQCYGVAFFEKECLIKRKALHGEGQGSVYEIE